MKSLQHPRPRSVGRRRLPSQLQSSRDGSFPLPVVDDINPVDRKGRRLHEPERSKYQRSETRVTQNQFNLRNDLTCIGRQIQKLACVAPMICSKDRERIEDIGRLSPDENGISYKDYYDSDFFDCETVFPDTNGGAVQIPAQVLQTNLYTDRNKSSLNATIPCPNYNRTNNYLRIVKKAHELNETQSTGSCSLEEDCVSYKYHYFAKRWNNHNNNNIINNNNNEGTDHSIEGRTESSSTDDGLEECTGKSAGATETTATESTNTLSRKRSNSLDDERIIRIPTIKLLNVSLLDQSDSEINQFNQEGSSVFDAGNADLDPLLIFEDDDFQAGGSQVDPNITDDSTRNRNVMNDTFSDDSIHRNVMKFVHCPSSSSLKDKLPERPRKLETINSPAEMRGEANNGIPTTIKFDPNYAELEVRSSIDENEIDNPDYLNFTYSPAGSFDYQQDLSPSTIEELVTLRNPSVTKLSKKSACVKQSSMGRIGIDGQEYNVPSAGAIPSDAIAMNVDDSKHDKDIVMAIIADLKQLENAEWFQGDQAAHCNEETLPFDRESSSKVLSNECNHCDSLPSPTLHARSHSLPNFNDSFTGVLRLERASMSNESTSICNSSNVAIQSKSLTFGGASSRAVSPTLGPSSKLDADNVQGNDSAISHLKSRNQSYDGQTEVKSSDRAAIYSKERRRPKVRDEIDTTRSQIQTLIDKFESGTINEVPSFYSNMYGLSNNERRCSESMYGTSVSRMPPNRAEVFTRRSLNHEQQYVSPNVARLVDSKNSEESNIPNKGFFWRSHPHGK